MPDRKQGLAGWIEVFRAGRQTDSQGRARTWSAGELDQIVANHNAAADQAPAVIGHPKSDSPAYGWVGALKRAGDSLLAQFRDVEPTFAQMVEQKRFPNRSVAIGKGAQGFFLRHVGWLGATPPAIEGLTPVTFAAASGEVYEFESDWYTPDLLVRLMRRLREWFIAEKSLETADQIIPEYLISDAAMVAESRRADASPQPAYSAADSGHAYSHPAALPNGEGEGAMSGPKTYTQADLDAAIASAREVARTETSAEFSASTTQLQAQLAAERRTRLAAEYQAAVDATIDAGRLLPAQAIGIVEFMLALPADDEHQFEFSTGEGAAKKTEKVAPLAWFQQHLAGLGKQITLGESEAGRPLEGATHDFAAPVGYAVDEVGAALDRKARDYMAAHPDIDYKAAIAAVK